ncbi:MAG: DUF937 domain-containing protein [Oscillatoriales cyanobacterium C42_A2020_001]|nr:DUF937 domain-containing protein [Leptolyngbyaceae cyanobacterium C42_A2020_001]
MGLFDQIAGAIANPNQQASTDQLGNILGMVQQLSSSQGIDPSTSQTMMSMVGGYVRSALQQKQAAGGTAEAENIVNQFSGLGANPAAVQALFSPDQQTQVANAISQRTGISSQQVMSLLALAVPIVLKMLQSGANTQGNPGSNNVLSTFLDSDNDGDVDIGDAIGMAGRFLQSR